MTPLNADQMKRLAEFCEELTDLSRRTGVDLSCVSPWVEVDGKDAGQLVFHWDAGNVDLEYRIGARS